MLLRRWTGVHRRAGHPTRPAAERLLAVRPWVRSSASTHTHRSHLCRRYMNLSVLCLHVRNGYSQVIYS